MSALTPPPKGWFHAPHGAEKVWIGVALFWCLVLSIAMPFWHYAGKQTSDGEAYKISPQEYLGVVHNYIRENKVGEETVRVVNPVTEQEVETTIPITVPTADGHAYLVGHNWEWYPVLKLRKGEEIKLHISSADYQHGISILPMNMNFHVMPGYDHVLTITPTQTGTFDIICNEFCGIGHHRMTGRIIVTD